MDAVLVGVQIEKEKGRIISGHTGQQGQVIFLPRQQDRHPALALGCADPFGGLVLGKQNGGRHQRQQDQQG